MINIRGKWQIVLVLFVMQLGLTRILNIYTEISEGLMHLSFTFGYVALFLIFAPYLKIYEYKEDKEKKKQLQKVCNVLTNLIIKKGYKDNEN